MLLPNSLWGYLCQGPGQGLSSRSSPPLGPRPCFLPPQGCLNPAPWLRSYVPAMTKLALTLPFLLFVEGRGSTFIVSCAFFYGKILLSSDPYNDLTIMKYNVRIFQHLREISRAVAHVWQKTASEMLSDIFFCNVRSFNAFRTQFDL